MNDILTFQRRSLFVSSLHVNV